MHRTSPARAAAATAIGPPGIVDAAAETPGRSMTEAAALTRTGRLAEATALIQRNVVAVPHLPAHMRAMRKIILASLARPEDYPKALELYQKTPYPKGIWAVTWAEEYNTWLKEKLFAFLQQDLDERVTADQAWAALRSVLASA